MRRIRRIRGKKTKRGASGPAFTTVVVMRLYIANNAPNSVRAVANLAAICKEHPGDKFKLEIIDVLEYPLRALDDGILVTPSLTKVSPSPAAKIIGNLSDKSSVLHALGIKESVV
jgi:circadian clock protein KaiB